MDNRLDAAVIGTGPAGLSAAITLKIRNKNVLVFGNEAVSRKVRAAHEIQNYLGLPHVRGEELAAAMLSHAQAVGVEIQNTRITAVYAMGDYFALQGADNRMYEASALILATGVSFGKPYPGETEFLGRGVSYCATCDAPLYRGKTVAVIAESPQEEAEAAFLCEVCKKVYYIPAYDFAGNLPENAQVVPFKPTAIEGGFKANRLVTDGGSVDVDCVFILRQAVSPAQLVPGLAVEGSHISVDRGMRTNLAGCFACGDCVGAPYQYIKAAGEGNIAALSAVSWLNEQKRN